MSDPESQRLLASVLSERSRKTAHQQRVEKHIVAVLSLLKLAATITIIAIGGSTIGSGLFHKAAAPPLETQVETSLKQLQDDSNKTITLIARLQEEMGKRQGAVREAENEIRHLQQERTALELTEVQKQAIRTLINHPQTARDLFTSREFWLGKVLVSTAFLIVGVVIGRMFKKHDDRKKDEKENERENGVHDAGKHA